MSSFLDWFRSTPPDPIEDPVFGVLEFKSGGWHSAPMTGDVLLVIEANEKGVPPAFRDLAAQAFAQLSTLEPQAQHYLRASSAKAWPALTLGAVIVGVPTREWVRREVSDLHPEIATALLSGVPCVTLQFSIEGDKNVAEATCFERTFIAYDYH